MENTSLSDALISLIPTYGPWIIFGIVALESAGVPLPGETILVAAALLAATTGQISIVVVVLASAGGAIVGDGIGYMVGRRFGLPLIRRYGRMAAHGAKRSFAVFGMSAPGGRAEVAFQGRQDRF
jgi:membrane protein DedA with SNARE-associated domain